MTDVHVTCLACFINPLKIAMWIVNEKWKCWNSECIVFRCDPLYWQAYFLGEKEMSLNTRICFWDNNICSNGFTQAFLHGQDSNLFFLKLNIYYVRDWLWEAPVGSLLLKSASKNLSLSPDFHAAAHVRSGEAACLIIGLIPQRSGCVTECCDSHPRLCSLSRWAFLNLLQLTSHLHWSVCLSVYRGLMDIDIYNQDGWKIQWQTIKWLMCLHIKRTHLIKLTGII